MPEALSKIAPDAPETASQDGLALNVERLHALFPEAFSEGRLDFEVLKELLGAQLETRPEKYGLNWHGKAAARRHALTPTRATLRPDPAGSVDWDTTQNLMIEGDNLEVLKLLQRSYAGKVKLIYIDPPYNTGQDFVYPDDYTDSIANYQALTGQSEEGRRVSSNAENSGRFHTDWLNMIYPRLKLARELLSDDGAILVSIGDEEVSNTKAALEELFGGENLSGILSITRSEGGGLAKQLIKGHDYLLIYAKNIQAFKPLRRPKDIRGEIVTVGDKTFWIEEDWLRKEFGKYGTCAYDEIENYHGFAKKNEIDDGIKEGVYRLIDKKDGRQIVGRLRDVETDSSKLHSVQKHLNSKASEDLDPLGMSDVFSFPKPTSLISEVVLGGSFFSKSQGDIILDFFAGSGTTGHAVIAQNAADGGNRQFILVQLPEPLDPKKAEQKAAADFCTSLSVPLNIAELTKERLRRAGAKVKKENPDWQGDTGFKVFKLDSSNLTEWDAAAAQADLEQTLENSVNNIKAGRSEQDVLFELLLKLGLELTTPIETRTLSGKQVHSVGAGALVVCLERGIDGGNFRELGRGIADWTQEQDAAGGSQLVFLDNGFADDIAKTNLSKLLEQRAEALGRTWTVRSI